MTFIPNAVRDGSLLHNNCVAEAADTLLNMSARSSSRRHGPSNPQKRNRSTLDEDDNWDNEENQTQMSKSRESAVSDDLFGNDDEHQDEESILGTRLSTPRGQGTVVSDLSDFSKQDLVRLVEEQRRTIAEYEMRGAKRQKRAVPLTENEKVIDNEVMSIVRHEIFRWLKFPAVGWNLWSEEAGSVCRRICDKMSSWPTGVTCATKKSIWDRVISPRLGRKLLVAKNKVTQKLKDAYYGE